MIIYHILKNIRCVYDSKRFEICPLHRMKKATAISAENNERTFLGVKCIENHHICIRYVILIYKLRTILAMPT